MENTVTPIISASAVEGIGSTIGANIATVAPALLGVMALVLVPQLIIKFVKRNVK